MEEIIPPVISQPARTVPAGLPKWPFIALFSFLLGIASVLAYQKYEPARTLLVAPSSLPTPSAAVASAEEATPDWKSYISNNLNLSFKYPKEYKPPEENNNYISLISPLNPEPRKGYELQNGELKVEIYVSDANPNETLADLIKKRKEQSASLGSNLKIIKEEEILVNGIKAVKQTWEGMGTGQTILLVNSNKEFGIIKYPAVTSRDNEFNQILSTFKFID